MAEESPPLFNPLSIGDLEKRAEILAKKQGFPANSPEADSFRHAYTAAMMTKYEIGGILTQGMGYVIEGLGIARNVWNGIQSIFDSGVKADSWDKTKSEMFKDLHNNEKGIEIGNSAADEDDIIQKVTEQIRNGTIITDSGESYERYHRESTPSQAPMFNILPGDGMWEGRGQNGFDPSRLIDILGGARHRDRAPSAGQVAMTSAAAIARELMKSKRRSLETDMIDIFTNSGKGDMFPTSTPPIVGNNSSQSGFADVMMNAVERMVGAAMNRTRTRTSTAESGRSQEAGRSWSPSRSQQQAMLAQWAQAGTRNL